MKMYSIVYTTKKPDFEEIVERAKYNNIKFEFGGGRKTKGGESPNAQIILVLYKTYSKISIARTGKVIVYYPSKVSLKKSIDLLVKCYAPPIVKSDLKCQGPIDPLSKAFILKTTENWNETELKLSEAVVEIAEFYDPATREYVYVLPDDDGLIYPPSQPGLVYSATLKLTIMAVDKDDKDGKRIKTGEILRWQYLEELKRISKEHRLKPEDIERAAALRKNQQQRKNYIGLFCSQYRNSTLNIFQFCQDITELL